MQLTTTITPADIALELERPAPEQGDLTYLLWERWIARAVRAIEARAALLRVPADSLAPSVVDDVVTYAVVRRASRPVDGAESTTDRLGVDVGSWDQTRRYPRSEGDIFILDGWWAQLGLVLPDGDHWSGSLVYGAP